LAGVNWIRRRGTLRGLTFDLGDLSLDERDVFNDLAAGRD
jgi:hypothetical protein